MLDTPQLIEGLEAIERDLAERQTPFAESAYNWFSKKRDMEKAFAGSFLLAQGSVEARKAQATMETSEMGKLEEADFEAKKRAIMVLETRASILQTLAKVGR